MATPIRALAHVAIVVALLAVPLEACRRVAPTPLPFPSPGPTAPAATPTPSPVVTGRPSPSPAPTPSASPAPSPSSSPTTDPAAIDAWAAEICRINKHLADGIGAITEQLPEPEAGPLAELQALNEQRRPAIENLLEAVADRLERLEQVAEGAPFQQALSAEMAARITAADTFFEAVASAEAIDDYEAAVEQQALAAQEATLRTARSVIGLDQRVTDAIAAIDSCRAFELDARGIPRGLPMPRFSRVVADDDLADPTAWTLPTFVGGNTRHADGSIIVEFEGVADRLRMAPPALSGPLPDVRVEATLALEGLAFSGVYCRGSDDAGYAAQVTGTGLLLLLRREGNQQTTLARHVLDQGAALQPLSIALECAEADGALAMAVDLDGQRLLEYTDTQPPSGLGELAGLVAHTLGIGRSETTFDAIRVLAPAE